MEKVDVNDRQIDFNYIHQLIERLELGIRAVSVMYDDHSSDVNSKQNIFRLKDNIYYRLISSEHHYKILLQEHLRGEHHLSQLTKDNPFKLDGFIYENPYYTILEMELSSIFDSIVFNLVSIFDYLSHIICYICQKNKQDTFYWTKLARTARGQNNDIASSLVKNAIDKIDRGFVCGLYDYRSRLIHNKRDQHLFSTQHEIVNNTNHIQIFISAIAVGYFKSIFKGHENDSKFTLIYLASWLIRNMSENVEELLDGLVTEIQSKSNYYHNIRGAKSDNAVIMMWVDPVTNIGSPMSTTLWNQFKANKIEDYLQDKS